MFLKSYFGSDKNALSITFHKPLSAVEFFELALGFKGDAVFKQFLRGNFFD